MSDITSQSDRREQSPIKNLRHETVIPVSDEFAAHMSDGNQELTKSMADHAISQSVSPELSSVSLQSSLTPPVAAYSLNQSDTLAQPSPAPTAPPHTPSSPLDRSDPAYLTAEQLKYIRAAAWGPVLSWIYYFGNKAWLYGILFLMVPAYLGAQFTSITLKIFEQPPATQTNLNSLSAEHVIEAAIVTVIATVVAIGPVVFSILRGRRIAWEARQWSSFESFKSSQKRWSLGAKIGIVFIIVNVFVYFVAFSGG